MQSTDTRRNDRCPCGSGKRYKNCHGAIEGVPSASLVAVARSQLANRSIADAERSARQAIERDATDADAWTVLGLSLESSRADDAFEAWKKAISLAPTLPEPRFRLGDFQRRRGEHAAAIASYESALGAGLRHPVLLNNLGLSLQELGRLDEAAARYHEALALQPDLIEANANLADVLRMQHRYAEAAAFYTLAVTMSPEVLSLWMNLGTCQHRIGEIAEARKSFERALALKPDHPRAMINIASLLLAREQFVEAAPLIEKTLALAPDLGEASNALLYVRQQLCDWRDFDRLFDAQRASLRRADGPPVMPHNLLALPYTPAELLAATRKWVTHNLPPTASKRPAAPTPVNGKLRIAYLGPDFRSHPLASLLSEVIERHDRSRFEVFGYSLGPDDGSPARARFAAAFDHFFDVRAESAEATAHRIADDRIAILFDTSGYVMHARSEIFALRPAPIQINCLGFPSTLGADCYDYVLTDRFVTPPEQQANFTERFLYLPRCYLPGDSKRAMAAAPTRAQCGLPERSFVFCCFNSGYKITPRVFDVWMRLLRAVDGSVLWLLEVNSTASANLRRETARRDIAADRLVFAPRVPLAEHLARHAVADLFLDTFPCNAHTTANDALFAGLPLLTCAGETFASRVSGSQLLAVGLPELVTDNLEAYLALALKLASDSALLGSLRNQLRRARGSSDLFNPATYALALERLLLGAWEGAPRLGGSV
jgi:predicted O-linked N-acetylglucosamine transferase (SPINDLY family)